MRIAYNKISPLAKLISRFRLRASIRTQLTIMVLVVSLCSMWTIAYMSYENGRTNLSDRIFEQLTSLRAARSAQITGYFQDLHLQAEALSQNWMVLNAMKDFQAAVNRLEERLEADKPDTTLNPNTQAETKPESEKAQEIVPDTKVTIPNDMEAKVTEFYEKQFLPRIAKVTGGDPVIELYKPTTLASRYLQYHYIVANPNPTEKRYLLNDAGDGSAYSDVHNRYHPLLGELKERFNYDDIMLVDAKTGVIVYNYSKQVDFARNILTGAYQKSNAAEAVRAVLETKAKNYVKVVDYAQYIPAFGAATSFIAAPIFDRLDLIGVLVLQMPVGQIDRIVSGDKNWQGDGLGKTGKTDLIGADFTMRNISRFLIENPENYFKDLRTSNVSENTIQKIKDFNTTILLVKVESTAVKEALEGKNETKIVTDARGKAVLSSYAPLEVEGLQWAIVAEIDLSEAYEPIYKFQRIILLWGSLLVLLVTLVAMFLSYIFIKPINVLIANAKRIARGNMNTVVKIKSNDEFSQLATSFNKMVDSLKNQTEMIEEKNRENDEILLKVFPDSIATRLKKGERGIAERISNVSVLFSDIIGFGKLYESMTIEEIVSTLNDLINSFDDANEKYGVDKIKTIGDNYMAACGLARPTLDHGKRAIDFALEMRSIVRRFSQERGLNLDIAIAIHSGDVLTGIIGTEKLTYDVWGDTVTTTNRILTSPFSMPGSILVSQTVYNAVQDIYELDRVGHLEVGGKENVELWLLHSTVRQQIDPTVAI
ncbi:MAG TPA: adenylate/guanylate cyclase domain-containing protein [Cyanobacteria bacterium UBA11149]|nr:adenylate/guanylate cyclase domain-containing protein [Cyanobacteria bacterium UBA11367]HBE58565.1 adenylate/guanylate cyclase domain-containing protein [Cyanobacteria bacterium UBA11366]HBR76499.1 adenylate/guanylate cyclase domain-containing protein [Cyanobacteria bacterium UBA11159]HBS67869.1 adenylate/guanylate cyclase domain-containing protein [Cyanobacteria bacterium UBA11153]HBW90092.1 adenylate/guanylate cyclase domain-containing protein [Cyanobacteria bacterium UBA11149]HCA93720.1 